MLVDSPTERGFAITSWGERSRTRITAGDTLGTFSMLDYRAPAGFGPPRHIHRDDDEIFLIVTGSIVLWMPDRCAIAGPGDVVLLPKAVPHTWRAYGKTGVHFQVIVAPGQFETFFERIAARELTIADTTDLADVAAETGVEILGPPLSDDDVADILRSLNPRAAPIPSSRQDRAIVPISSQAAASTDQTAEAVGTESSIDRNDD